MTQELVLVAYAILALLSILEIVSNHSPTQPAPRSSLWATASPTPTSTSTPSCTRQKPDST